MLSATGKILLTFISLFLIISALPAQNPVTLAKVELYEHSLIQPDVLEFKVRVIRTSNLWDTWANGTFQFVFDDPAYPISPANLEITRMFDTDLDVGVLIGKDLPTDSYLINPHIIDGRIGVAVVGPEEYDVSQPVDTSIKIETFRIRSLDGSSLPKKVRWLKPANYYQACAYKIRDDSTVHGVSAWFSANDNIEMDFLPYTAVEYIDDDSEGPEMEVINFKAFYGGAKQVQISWETLSEAYNKGFILDRGMTSPFVRFNIENIDYNVTVGRFDQPGLFQQELVGLGTRKPGRKYKVQYDTVVYRDMIYGYRLSHKDFYNSLIIDAYDTLFIPHAVISAASASPNPFSDDTEITYTVDDDCIISANVYDELGKKVLEVFNRETRQKGTYRFTLIMPEFASQGLYEIIFIATPIDDPTIELSQAVIKMQLIR